MHCKLDILLPTASKCCRLLLQPHILQTSAVWQERSPINQRL